MVWFDYNRFRTGLETREFDIKRISEKHKKKQAYMQPKRNNQQPQQQRLLQVLQLVLHRHKVFIKRFIIYAFSTKSLVFEIYENLFVQKFWPLIKIEHLYFSVQGNFYASSPYDVDFMAIESLKIY